MKCQEVDSLLPAWALEEISSSERVEVDRHLKTCASCQEALSEVQDALGLLAAVPVPEPSPDLGERTVAALDEERALAPSWTERWGRFSYQLSNLRVTPLRGVLATALGFMFFFMLVDFNVVPASAPGAASVCHKNVRQLGQAVTEYQAAHQGELPESLADLVPDYLQAVPTCPAARQQTYSSGYEKDTQTGEFQLFCHGHHHAAEQLQPDMPRYSPK